MSRDPSSYVTWHARLRFLDRVMGIDVEGFRRDLAAIDEIAPNDVKDGELTHWILAAYSMDEADLDKRIATPRVIEAIKAGAAGVRIEGVRFAIKNSMIVTCVRPGGTKATSAFTRQDRNRVRRGRKVTGQEHLKTGVRDEC